MKQTGALFDLDGVLIDTEPLYTEFWAEIGRKFELPSPTFAYDIKGSTLTNILTTNFPDPQVKAEVERLIHEFEDHMVYRLFPGAEELLLELRARGVKTAIVTSSDNVKMSYLFAQQPGLRDLVDTIINGSMVTRSKPDPEGYLMAAERLGVPIADCYVFEDSLQGVEAGRRSGAKVIALSTTNAPEKLQPMADRVYDAIDRLSYDEMMSI